MSASDQAPAAAAQPSGQPHENPLDALKEALPDFPAHNASLVDSITSYLGRHNPFTSPVDPETTLLWLFDNTAWQSPSTGGKWQAELVACYFVRRTGAETSQLVAQLAKAIGLAEDEEARKTIAKRLVPFLNQILPAHTAQITIGDDAALTKIGPSDRNGISHDTLVLPEKDWKDGEMITSRVGGGVEHVPGTTTFATSEGFAVVSDIDDTIKITMTNAPLGILKTTFVDDPKPVDGMPEFYAHLNTSLGKPPFWYLSASPYNLYGALLRPFREKYYPLGTMLLRDASWMNLAGFLASLTQGTQKYKVDHLKTIAEYWPHRKLVCIGDSTQSDPEAYGEMYRAKPGFIKAIWIRKVQDIAEAADIFPGQGEEERNKPERFEKAFEGVPKDVWHVFEDPKELYEKVDTLVKG